MKIQIKNTEVELKNKMRSLLIYEQITNKPFNPTTVTDMILYFYSTILACKPDIDLTFDELKRTFGDIFEQLTHNEKVLLERYYVIPERKWYGNTRVEKEVNLVKYGFKNPKVFANKAQLYKTYLANQRYFNDEQRLYLECCFFKNEKKTFREKYPSSNLIKQDIYLIERLEKIHYRVFRMTDNTFTKEKYLEVKEKYGKKLGEDRIKLLDLFYGVDGPEVKIADMATMFNMEYIYIHDRVRDAREFAISLYYNRIFHK